MKTLCTATVLTVTLASLVSCKNETKNDNHNVFSNTESANAIELTFNDDKVGRQFRHYIHLKTALVNSDVNEAQAGAKMLMENTGDADLKALLLKISATRDIEVQRTLFSDVTEMMTEIVAASISSSEVYRQFCPMAFNNQGGYWLSTEEEIHNPYFGDRMLSCGQVTETIR